MKHKFQKSKIENDPSYVAIRDFANKFIPKEDINYQWVYEYFVGLLGEARLATINLESKALKIVEFIAPLMGIAVSLLAIYTAQQHSLGCFLITCLIFFFLSLALAIFFAFKALSLREWAFGPKMDQSLLLAEHYKDSEQKALGHQSAAMMMSICWMQLLMKDKGGNIRYSYFFLFVGLFPAVLLFVAVLSTL
jgi:hypothetical protein